MCRQSTPPRAAAESKEFAAAGTTTKSKQGKINKGHSAFDSKVTADSIANAFAKAESEGSMVSGKSGRSGASKASARARAAKKQATLA